MRSLGLLVVGVAALAACSSTSKNPGDTGGAGGTGASGGSSGAPSGGSAGGGSLPACNDPKAWSTTAVPPGVTGATALQLVARPSKQDTVLLWRDGSEQLFVTSIGASASQPVLVATGAKLPRMAWSDGQPRLGIVWFGTTLSISLVDVDAPLVKTRGVYSDGDPGAPDGKKPDQADIAPRGASGWGIVWRGFADGAGRLFSVHTDTDGIPSAPNAYVPLTVQTETASDGSKGNPAVVGNATGFALAYADNYGQPSPAAWTPDVRFTELDFDLDGPSPQAVEPSPGISDYPALALEPASGAYAVAWIDSRSFAPRVWLARLGASGGGHQISDEQPPDDRPPSIAAAPGTFAVAWRSGDHVQFATETTDGELEETTIATGAAAGTAPSVVWTGAGWAVAWTSTTSAPLQVSKCP